MEKIKRDVIFLVAAIITIVVTLFVIGYVFYSAIPIFQKEGINFIIGTTYDYDTHKYGILIFISGTILLTVLALILACPLSIFSAIFMAEFAPRWLMNLIRPVIELLVGIPSVVYGLFGMYVFSELFAKYVYPAINGLYVNFHISFFQENTYGNGFLLASTVLAIMIIPTITILSLEALKAIPNDYKEASYALGATRWETIKKVSLKFAAPGIITGIIFGMMRALGETMAIVMLLGNSQHMPRSILDTGFAMTSKILIDAQYYLIMQEPRSAIFGIAAVLFIIETSLLLVAKRIGAALK